MIIYVTTLGNRNRKRLINDLCEIFFFRALFKGDEYLFMSCLVSSS